MRISRRHLEPDERLLFAARIHPIRLLGPGLRAVAGITAALALGYYATPGTGTDTIDLVGAVIALVVLGRFLWRSLGWRRRGVVLTDRRLLRLSGGILRRVGSISVARISEVELVRGIGGRLLGYGTVEVVVGGDRLAVGPLREARRLWTLLAEGTDEAYGTDEGYGHRERTPSIGVPLDQRDTGPLPRVPI